MEFKILVHKDKPNIFGEIYCHEISGYELSEVSIPQLSEYDNIDEIFKEHAYNTELKSNLWNYELKTVELKIID